MGKPQNLGHLAHLVAYNAENHITVPAGITMHTNQLVASQAWVTTALGSYALSSSLGSYVPTSRTITINGTAYDLSADRSWNITSMIYPDAGIPLSTGSAWGTSITNNSANWNTAYGWGNHASAGYLTSISSLDVVTALGYAPYNGTTNPNGYITGITSSNVTTALGYTPVTNARTITINGTAYDLSANREWTVSGSDSTKLPLAGGIMTGSIEMATSGTSYIRMGRFPNSTSNSGEAWIGRASDRNTGTMTVQLGGGVSSSRSFEVVDYAWTTVLFNVNSDGNVYSSSSFRAPQFRLTNSTNNSYITGDGAWGAKFVTDNGYIWIGPANNGTAHIYTDRPSFYFNAPLLVNGTSVVTNSGTWSISVTGSAGSVSWGGVSGRPTALSNFTNDVGYITGVTNISGNSATTSQREFNYLRINSNNHLYLDYNYGQSIIGVYSASRYQGVFSMGASYVLPLDGTSPGNLYGMAWSHPNAGGQAGYLNDHGLLVMVNGVTYAAISSNIWARGNVTANGYVYANGSMRLGDMWEGGGIYRSSGNLVFGTEGAGYKFMVSGTQRCYIGTDGNIWMQWLGDYISNRIGQDVRSSAGPTFANVYTDGWFRNYGYQGLYNQSYGCHLRANASSSHGSWEIFGYNKAGYNGFNIQDPSGYNNNLMYEGGNGGVYTQNGNGWQWYYNIGSNCIGLASSGTDSGVRVRANGSMRVTGDFNAQGYTGFNGNVEWSTGTTQYHGSDTGYNWRDWGGWGGYWWSRNGGDMIMNLYALYSVTGSISDIRYKKDVEALPYGLNEIMQLNPIKYHYNLPKESMLSNDPDYFLGFSAQEVQALIPEAVHEKVNEDVESLKGMLAITYDELIPVTVQAIKEQQVMIHNQNIRIQKLEALVTQLLNN